MGILTRKRGTEYIITSDRSAADLPTSRAPKTRPDEIHRVWTGKDWSAEMTEAKTFDTLDHADDYVRANFAKVTGLLSPASPKIRRPANPANPVPGVPGS